MKQLIKKILREAVGVPSNIEKAAENLYNDFIERIESEGYFDVDDNGTDISFRFRNEDGRYSFGDFNPNTISIELSIRFYTSDEQRGPLIYGMGHIGKGNVNKNLNLVSRLTDNVDLQVLYAQPNYDSDVTIEKIIGALEQNRNESISSLAHELKHAYDSIKKPESTAKDRAKYQIYTDLRNVVIPMNEFFFNLYFIHNVENLVRPVEVYTDMVQSGVKTKEEFLDFFTNQKTLSTLRIIANSDIDTLIDKLSQNESQLDKFLTKFNQKPENLDLEEKVLRTLEVYYEIYKENLEQILKNYATQSDGNPLSTLFGSMFGTNSIKISDYHQNIIKKLTKEFEKFDNNRLDFYDYEMNRSQNVAKTMIKKLSKLFSLINTEKTVKTEIFDPMNFEMDQLRQKIKKK